MHDGHGFLNFVAGLAEFRPHRRRLEHVSVPDRNVAGFTLFEIHGAVEILHVLNIAVALRRDAGRSDLNI